MLWLRLAGLGVVLAVIAGAAFKFASFLNEKDRMIQSRDQQILNLNAKVEGMRIDNDHLKESNASLDQELKRKIEEAAAARREADALRVSDTASNKRQADLERKLNDHDRQEKVDRLTHSRHAELTVRVVNNSARCELENFFRTDGQCRSGVWVADKAPTKGDIPVAQGGSK